MTIEESRPPTIWTCLADAYRMWLGKNYILAYRIPWGERTRTSIHVDAGGDRLRRLHAALTAAAECAINGSGCVDAANRILDEAAK